MWRLKLIESEELKYDQEPPGRIRERAKKILAILREYRDKSPTFDKHHTRWASAKIAALVSDAVAADIIYNELAVLAGSYNSDSELVKFACSIAGAVHFAKIYSSAEIGAVDVQSVDCWGIISSMVIRDDRFGKVFDCGIIFANSVFAGVRTVVVIEADKSRWWCQRAGLLGTIRNRLDFYTSYQLLGANLVFRVSKLGGQIIVDGAGVNVSTLAANKELAKSRSRRHTACPYDFDCDCGRCDVGTNECKLSTYPIDTTVIKDLGDGSGTS